MLLKSLIMLSGLFAVAIAGSHAGSPEQDSKEPGSQRASLVATTASAAQRDSKQSEDELTVFRLRHILAHEAVDVLNQTIRSRESRIAADSRSNSLVFVGTEDDAARARQLLELLDQPTDDVGEFKVFPLEHAACHEMVNVLQRLLYNVEITLVADGRTNSILAQGSSDGLAIAEAMITQLDRGDANDGDGQAHGEDTADLIFEVIYLRSADSSQAADVVHQLIGNQMPVSVVADPEHNSLIVKGKEADVKVVTELVSRLDVEREKEGRTLRSYKLDDVLAEDAMAVLQTLIVSRWSSARMSYNAASNSIIFYGNEEENELVQTILQELNADSSLTVETSASAETEGASASYKVRLIWLSDDGESDASLPEDLQPVANELAEYGFNDLEIAGQLMVNTTASIECAGQIIRDNGEFQLYSSGFLMESGDDLKLSLNIGIHANALGTGGGGGSIAETSTEIFTQAGRLTVLGVSPSQSSTAIFVVQVLEN